MKKLLTLVFMLILPITVAAKTQVHELVIMTHDSFSVSKEIIASFETDNNAKLRFLKAGDAGAALNQAILSKSNPMADIFYGIDNTFFSRAINADIFVPYASSQLKNIPSFLKLDPKNRLIPVDFGDVCLNFDKKWFLTNNITPPSSLEDIAKPQYKGLTVVENPATSSPGLAFLLATVDRFGEKGFLDYWKLLKKNDIMIVNGWKEAYWGQFSAASKGNRPIVVSYASSPAAEVYYSKEKLSESPTQSVTANGSIFRQIEFAGILKGTKKKALAKKFMDYILGKKFQEDIPLQMFMFPSNATAKLPAVFIDYAEISAHNPGLTTDDIAKNRDNWIESWSETVLR